MTCPYYYWDHDFACRRTGKRVDEDWYYKYCRKYDYSDCPIYKTETDSGSSSGCYLTSACVEAMGLEDDCRELQTLRGFRDTYMHEDAQRAAEVCHYYHTAPKIVEAINAREDAGKIYTGLYHDLVKPCVSMIEQGNLAEAYALYRNTSIALKEKYLKYETN